MKILKWVWILLSLCVLIVTLVYYDATDPANDVSIFFIYAMLLISFPSGFIAAALLSGLAFFGIQFHNGYITFVGVWSLFFLCG